MSRAESESRVPGVSASPGLGLLSQGSGGNSAAVVLGRFSEWTGRYLGEVPGGRAELLGQGLAMARERRQVMADLIRSKPEEALALAVSQEVRQALPAAVRSLLEERVSGWGDLALLAAVPEPGKESLVKPNFRIASIGGKDYEAFVYGRREQQNTLRGVALSGIAVGNCLAVDEYAVGVTEPGGAVGFGGGEAGVAAAGPTYTTGTKRLIVIRVDFADLPGDPFSDLAGLGLLTNLHRYFLDASRGATEFRLPSGEPGDTSVLTVTLRLPETAAYYGLNNLVGPLRADARTAASAAGYTLDEFDFDIVAMGRVPGFSWLGLGYIGAPGAWLRITSSAGTAAHELGHNLGLNHANFWDTGGLSVVGAGTSLEYGDNFDTMGSGGSERVFNARYKRLLGWLEPEEIVTVLTNGLYRIYAHDLTNGTGLTRALQIPQVNGTNYWVEFRQKPNDNRWAMNGALLRWAFSSNQKSLLLDTTPGSPDGRNDCPILIGQTFSDQTFGIHITVLGKGGTDPESLDVVVERGGAGSNLPPAVVLSASATNLALGQAASFSVSALDPNGDALAFAWDFGDGAFGANNPAVDHAWTGPGEYRVRCTVSDMRGGRASGSVIVRVGAPPTYRISGRVLTDNLVPLEGVRVSASANRVTYTDSDGRYDLVGLPGGAYTVTAVRAGFELTQSGFANPVTVGPNAQNIDFTARPEAGQNLIALVPAGSVWSYWDEGSDPGTGWATRDFDDRLWKSGRAQLGYGDGDEVTETGYGPDASEKYITTYFRHAFVVDDPVEFAGLTLELLRDDGGVVYLNGREVFRSNMPPGPIDYHTQAASSAGGFSELTFFAADVLPVLLEPGTNVLAVEIHQQDPDSSDLSFDLSLRALRQADLSRGVYLASPATNTVLIGPTNLFLLANASAGGGRTISRVEFYEGARSLGEAGLLPFSVIWSNLSLGTYSLHAEATDSAGSVLTSAPVRITVGAVLIPPGAEWKYFDQGIDLGTAWTGSAFDDSAWAVGPAELGYGDGDEATLVGYGGDSNNRHITTYFRRPFLVEDPAVLTDFLFRLRRDDGAVVHLNGVELYRSNMPQTGPVTFQTVASLSVGSDEERIWHETVWPAVGLALGTNLLAVEVHQRSATSSDVSFDLEMVAFDRRAQAAPVLGFAWTNGLLTLFWPTDPPGWRLYSAWALASSPGWAPVESGVVDSNGTARVTLAPAEGSRFFRLSRP